jgi:hypothetical protein
VFHITSFLFSSHASIGATQFMQEAFDFCGLQEDRHGGKTTNAKDAGFISVLQMLD